MSNTTTVATPGMPQTTSQPAGGPFVRHSEPGKARIYDLTGIAYGGLVNQPLTAIPGYVSEFRLRFTSSPAQTVSGAANFLVGSGDAPFNCVQLIQVFDALGTPIYALPGFEAFQLVPMFSGGFGLFPTCDVKNLPSYQAIGSTAGTQGAGVWQFATAIPLEFAKGIGVLGMADGSTLPKIQVQFNALTALYGTTFTGTPVPTIEMRLNADFYWLPAGANVAPPGLGSTRQWFLQQGYPAIGSAATATVTVPRQGGWLDTLIFILRDTNSNRLDAWPTIVRFKIDGIGEIETNIDEIYDDMAVAWGVGANVNNGANSGTGSTTAAGGYNVAAPRPVGVIAFSRKTSLGRQVLGLLDTYETAISTSAGTSMSVEGAPWGAITGTATAPATGITATTQPVGVAPATLNALLGQVIPSGALIQGLAEL